MPAKQPEQLALSKPPGPWHLAVTAAALAVLATAWCEWWPRDDGAALLAWAGAMLVLLVCAVWWAICSFDVLARDRRWSWRVAAAPAAVGLAAAVVWWGLPDFGQARPQLERIAAELRAEPGPAFRGGLPLERFDIVDARDDGAGTVFFIRYRNYISERGWMHAPAGPPGSIRFTELEPLGGGWYRYKIRWD